VTKAEFEFIERRRKALGLSISEYMRKAALRGFLSKGEELELQPPEPADAKHPEYDEDSEDTYGEEEGRSDSQERTDDGELAGTSSHGSEGVGPVVSDELGKTQS
jgi:hypothetical protein